MPIKRMLRSGLHGALRASGLLDRARRRRVRSGDDWASVLVFHGVTPDEPEDGVTISPTRFRAILRMLRARYDVLAMSELVERLERRSGFSGREVVITFDDGYLNNFEHAVPLLLEHELPACFFLTAGYIGTRDRFWWDEAKGVAPAMMEWTHAREVASLGFELGSHTWSHPDLGSEPIAAAAHELRDSRERIEHETGATVRHFAYPYGGRDNIRPEWIEAVRDAGYRSCSAAFNGHVAAHTDRYFIPRIGAAPQRSLAELRVDIDQAW